MAGSPTSSSETIELIAWVVAAAFAVLWSIVGWFSKKKVDDIEGRVNGVSKLTTDNHKDLSSKLHSDYRFLDSKLQKHDDRLRETEKTLEGVRSDVTHVAQEVSLVRKDIAGVNSKLDTLIAVRKD